jgi:hypothetical protein
MKGSVSAALMIMLFGIMAALAPAAVKAKNAESNSGCDSTYLNSPKVLGWLNSSIGQPRGFPSPVGSVGDIEKANPEDLTMLGLPGTDGVVAGGHPAAIACHITVVLQNGLQRSGILNVIAPTHKIFTPGPNQSLVVSWAPDDVIEAVRQQAAVSQERDREQEKANLQQARVVVQNDSNQQACYEGWKIAVEAKSLLASGETSDQVVEDLERRYAYGPNGELYRDSENASELIKHITYTVQMTSEERLAKHVPDYTSQAFLADCPRLTRQQGN